MALAQPGRNYGSKIKRRSHLLCSTSKNTPETHQLTGRNTKILSLLACNYSSARYAELGVPEHTSEGLGRAEEVVELCVHSTKSGRNTAPWRLGYLQDEEDRQEITAWIRGEAH